MPVVRQEVDICCLSPLDSTVTYDVDGCIESVVSDYGAFTHTVDITRGPPLVYSYTVADA